MKNTLQTLLLFSFFHLSWWAQAQYDPLKLGQRWGTNLQKLTVSSPYEFQAYIPRNAIPPIYHSDFWNKRQAEETYFPEEPMVTVKVKHIEKAYPISVLMYHQVINDYVGKVPVAVTFCPLSGAAIVYDRRVEIKGEERVLKFGSSGMLRFTNTVLWDLETESWWQQLTGASMVGDLAGSQLKVVPFQVLSYEAFFKAYPYGIVMVNNIDDEVPYGTNPYYQYDDEAKVKPFLLTGLLNARFPAMQRVISIESMGEQFLYPLRMIRGAGVLNDTPNDNYVVIFHQEGMVSPLDAEHLRDSKDLGMWQVFSSMYNGERLIFKKQGGQFIDENTGSIWNMHGECTEGDLKGASLRPLQGIVQFAYAPLLISPECRIYGESY